MGAVDAVIALTEEEEEGEEVTGTMTAGEEEGEEEPMTAFVTTAEEEEGAITADMGGEDEVIMAVLEEEDAVDSKPRLETLGIGFPNWEEVIWAEETDTTTVVDMEEEEEEEEAVEDTEWTIEGEAEWAMTAETEWVAEEEWGAVDAMAGRGSIRLQICPKWRGIAIKPRRCPSLKSCRRGSGMAAARTLETRMTPSSPSLMGCRRR